jgi:DNA replication protein DnaC
MTEIKSLKPIGDVMDRFLESMKTFKPSPEQEALMFKHEQKEAEQQREAERRRAESRLDSMRIPKRYRGLSLKSYTATSEKQNKVVGFLQEYGERNHKERENLIIHGAPGTGKTHMICAFIQDCHRTEAQYWKLSDIMRTVKDSYSSGGDDTELRFIKRLAEIPILVIDEIGRQGGTSFEGGFMFDLLDDRYDNLLPTILISNLPVTGEPSMTSYLGISVMDRINENSLDIPCEWNNYRDHAEIVIRTRLEGGNDEKQSN